MAEFISGEIYEFNCCSEGRRVDLTTDGTCINQDGLNTDGRRKHPFVVLHDSDKNKSGNYISVFPITSQKQSYTIQEYGQPISSDDINKQGYSYIGSMIQCDKPLRILKTNITNHNPCGKITHDFRKKIISKMVRGMNAHGILVDDYKKD